MTRDEFNALLDAIREKLGEESAAIVADELVSVLGAYSAIIDERDEQIERINALEKEKDELIKVNGKLYRRIGFEDEDSKLDEEKKEVEEIKIEDVINEKGEII